MAKKKKRSNLKSIVITLLALSGISVGTYYLLDFLIRPVNIRYAAFGINIPPGYAIHGIDVSRYQRVINWNDVKDMQVNGIKIGFVFIKATEGVGKIDAQFRRNWLKAAQEGMPKGAYHYFTAGKSGKAQAQNFIDIVKLEKGDLPPVLDIEKTNGINSSDLRKEALIWLTKIEKHYKIKPIIYTNINFYSTFLRQSFDEYPFWAAHYVQAGRPRASRNWIFWQHSEQGRVNGIRSAVDFNIFSGDSTDFSELLIK